MPSKTIRQDGKVYTFTPGKNGSLTAPADNNKPREIGGNEHVAKTVPCVNCNEPMSENASSCSACGALKGQTIGKGVLPVGGVRG